MSLRSQLEKAIEDWVFDSPTIGPKRIIIGCDFNDLVEKIVQRIKEHNES